MPLFNSPWASSFNGLVNVVAGWIWAWSHGPLHTVSIVASLVWAWLLNYPFHFLFNVKLYLLNFKIEYLPIIRRKALKTVIWIDRQPSCLPFTCLVAEVIAIALEQVAQKSHGKLFLLTLALSISITALLMIIRHAYMDLKRSGATRGVSSPGKYWWWYYPDGDAYNCTQEIIAVAISITQIWFAFDELRNFMKPKPVDCNCPPTFICPLIVTVAEFAVFILVYSKCVNSPKIFCEMDEEYIPLHQMRRRGRKTFQCPGCRLAKDSGGRCIMPRNFKVVSATN